MHQAAATHAVGERAYIPFIDWMKAVGICLIVMGHVAARPTDNLVPPIYPKQLGVAFFLFVMGYSLARETRPRWQVLFNRLFEVYLFGGAIAVLVSAVSYAAAGTLQLSNYLPLFLGANLLFDNFPANPTTWYIGTYLHVLVFWALVLRGRRVRGWWIALALSIEVALRAVVMATAGHYVAYMMLPNWLTVIMIGTLFGQRAAGLAAPPGSRAAWLAGYGVLTLGAAAAWFTLVSPRVAAAAFPFMRLRPAAGIPDVVLTSACVSAVYATAALLAFQLARRLPAAAVVQWLARNTLIIFILHMPLFYALDPWLRSLTPGYAPRAITHLVVCLPGLGLLSEGITRLVQPRALRRRVVAAV